MIRLNKRTIHNTKIDNIFPVRIIAERVWVTDNYKEALGSSQNDVNSLKLLETNFIYKKSIYW